MVGPRLLQAKAKMKRAKRNSSLCAYRNCKNDFKNKNTFFFKFPPEEERYLNKYKKNQNKNRLKSPKFPYMITLPKIRCKLWLEASERQDLLENWKEAEDFRLCQDHFEDSMFLNSLKNRLIQTAIPTIFEAKIKTDIKTKWVGKEIVQKNIKKLKYQVDFHFCILFDSVTCWEKILSYFYLVWMHSAAGVGRKQ